MRNTCLILIHRMRVSICVCMCVCVGHVCQTIARRIFGLCCGFICPLLFGFCFAFSGRVPLSTVTPSSCLFIYNSISLLALPVTAAAYGKRLLKFRINKLNVFAVYFKFRLKNLSMEGGKAEEGL